ncbi:3-hydroxybutyryl-CoA dehydrogenase [Streptomyces sp. 11-1-2]|uniref:3-hydroxybutyryl-CoA dehydrogenase n=1 Tax=unclassified Streptomyces TaxID=2593676 RepID=UPI000B8D4947|nr:3-hydroxybutyryl-CoA dehydrogenase [Streptomyces sp. 11-1-2]ASQ93508.1 3-hydroxybutyryl-CoA dehydrogenase [Streptomyces sp. 11-1-2]
MTDPQRIGVVGCGLMGAGIAEVCARAGLDVVVADADGAGVERGRVRVRESLSRAVTTGKVDAESAGLALARLRFTTDLDEFADRELVVEAVAEHEELKTEIFARLDKVVEQPDALLASNTSSIPIMKLAMATNRPQQVIGIHFFNPVPVLRLVELVPSLLTAARTRERAERFAVEALGKQAITAGDRAGFVVNALLIPYLLSAIRMMESGFASAKDIDTGMQLGCAHPMGPLRLADLVGLDTVQAAAEAMYDEFKEPLYFPPPVLQRMVEAGQLGSKSGQGFYQY